VIKLPYIIGSEEYRKHDYAGVIYMGDAENEQDELYAEEQEMLKQRELYE